jgi:hypothetical protein
MTATVVPQYVLDALIARYEACRAANSDTINGSNMSGLEENADAAVEYFDDKFAQWLEETS